MLDDLVGFLGPEDSISSPGRYLKMAFVAIPPR
jgi:hypothetical protein